MKSTAARTVVVIIGGLAVLVGGVWIGQGAGLIKGSFMTGSATWLAIGLLCLVAGLFLIFLALRRRSNRAREVIARLPAVFSRSSLRCCRQTRQAPSNNQATAARTSGCHRDR